MTQEFQAKDTTVVQVRSVLNFMYTLGYTLDETGKRFFTTQREGQGNRYLSIRTAVALHNGDENCWTVQDDVAFPVVVKLQQGFSVLGVRLAMASKLVKQVKFSLTRTGKVIMQDVMVKPLNDAVYKLVEPAPEA